MSVVSVLISDYISLCRGLEYLLKARFIILVDPNGAKFLIFKTVFWVGHKNKRYLRFATHIFTKLSQNMCLVNTQFFIYWYVRCDCKLWNVLWFYCVFFGIFIHYWRPFISELLYIFSKLLQIVYLNKYILMYWHARCNFKLRMVF